jgi:hypothetical protein
LALAERLKEDSPLPTYYWNSQAPLTRHANLQEGFYGEDGAVLSRL